MLVHSAIYKEDIPKEDKNVDIPQQSRASLCCTSRQRGVLCNAHIGQKHGDIGRRTFG
jgi:hypothetical protein